MMPELSIPTPTRRRWFQFSLRELFWLMLVVAISLYAAKQRHRAEFWQQENQDIRRNAKAELEVLVAAQTNANRVTLETIKSLREKLAQRELEEQKESSP
jgi:hypothetical protein